MTVSLSLVTHTSPLPPLNVQLFPREVFTQQAYLWATAVLDSRALYWDGQPRLVPFLDAAVMVPAVLRSPRRQSQSSDATEPLLATDALVRGA